MIRSGLSAVFLVVLGAAAYAADACQDFTKLTDLPPEFKTIGRSAIGPAKMEIKSNGKCTCNNLPAAQRSLGQSEPDGVNWACDVADPADAKGR